MPGKQRTVGLCRDCRWWGAVQFADAAGFRECAKTQATLYPGFVDPDHQKTFAYAAVDGEDTDHAVQWLMTAPEFGCVQFAAKE